MKKDVTEIKDTNRFKYIVKGTIFSYIFTFLCIIIYSVILSYTNISDSTIPFFVIGIVIASVFTATCIFCRQIGYNGLSNGLIISSIYIGFMYVISSFSKTGFAIDKYGILMMFTIVIVGGIGGIIGVNFRNISR